jgi:DNA topoisomerase-1
VRALAKLQQEGIRRVGSPRAGFRFFSARGQALGRAEVERIRALRIPPAWTDVRISPLPSAKLQAIGRDRAGRWQYRYHPEFARRRAAAKYRRLLRFASALPRIRAAVARDMRRRGLARERVLATMVRILETCHMRPGSEAYVAENGSYGLTTIRAGHVEVAGDRVVFDYPGKSGQRQVRELRDRRVARLVRTLLRTPGRDLFQFEDEDGGVVDVRRRHLNTYIREAAGAPFTAKDFRTWAGTLVCASELARALSRADSPAPRKRLVNAALDATARQLGNTRAVARASYVSPAVLDEFVRGRAIACGFGPDELFATASRARLHAVERALVAFLRQAAPRPGPRVLRGGGRAPTRAARPAGPTAKPLRRAARGPDRE